MSSIHIYSLSDPINGYVKYIGKTNDINRRYYQHLNDKSNNRKSRWVLSLSKKGLKPNIEILETVDENNWEFWEQYYISLFKSWGFILANLDSGGAKYKKRDKETLLKLSTSNTGKKGYWTGKKRDKDTIEKIASKNRGRKLSVEHREKVVKSLINSPRTPERYKKVSLALTGKKLSDDHKKKLSDNHTRKTAVIQLDLNGKEINRFQSFTEAVKYLGAKRENIWNISMVCKGKAKTALGYKWSKQKTENQ